MERVNEAVADYREVREGVFLADLATGRKAGMKHWRIDPGAVLPVHQHEHEQIGYMVHGTLTALVDGEEVILEPGDSYLFPSNEPHGAENRGDEPAVGVGILSPPRGKPDWDRPEVGSPRS